MPAIACTQCKRSLTVADNLVGKAIKCPMCSATFVANSNGTSNGAAKAASAAAPIPCPTCKRPLTLPPTAMGKPIKCPLCSAVFTPTPPKAPAAPAPKQHIAPGASTAKILTLPCNKCKKPLNIPETLVGKPVKCPQCSATFTAQKPATIPAVAPKPAAAPALANITCDACRKPLRLPETLVGNPVKCPHCAATFTAKRAPATGAPAVAPKPSIPIPAKPPMSPPTARPPAMAAGRPSAPAGRTPSAPASMEAKVTIHCARCKRPLRLPESALGKPLRCPRCRMVFAAKPKAPDVATWINYPVEKGEPHREEKAAAPPPAPKAPEPAAPPPPVVRVDPVPPPASTPHVPIIPAAAHYAAEDAVQVPGLAKGDVFPEPASEQPEPRPREDSSEDVFAAYLRDRKKKRKSAPAREIHVEMPEEPAQPEENYEDAAAAEQAYLEPAAESEPQYAESESQYAEQTEYAEEQYTEHAQYAEQPGAEEEVPHAEAPAESEPVAESETHHHRRPEPEPDAEGGSGGSVAKWFAIGLVLGGLSAAGVGALFIFHVV
jgi:LSD1 subclass zinc finger protein